MKNTLNTLLTLLWVVSGALYAQQSTSHPVALKTNLGVNTRDFPFRHAKPLIGVEVWLSPNVSIEQEAGPIIRLEQSRSSNIFDFEGYEEVAGVQSRTRIRLYQRSKDLKTSLFFAPGLNFIYREAQFSGTYQSTRIPNGSYEYDYLTARREWQVEFLYGIQRRFLKRCLVEGMVGPSFRQVSSNQDGRFEYFPRYSESNVYNGKLLQTGNIWAPSWRASLRVGVLIGKVPGETSGAAEGLRRGVIKWYPAGSVFNDHRIGYEQPLTSRWSINIMGGMHKRLLNDSDGEGGKPYRVYCDRRRDVQGFTVKAGPRWYIMEPVDGDKALYLEGWLGYRQTRFDPFTVYMPHESVSICRDIDYYYPLSKRIAPFKQHASFQLNGGYQALALKHLVIEGYAGVGFRKTWLDENQIPQDDILNLSDEEAAFLAPRNSVSFIRPTLHGGISIGWGL